MIARLSGVQVPEVGGSAAVAGVDEGAVVGRRRRGVAVCALLVSATIVGLAGTDLVLPVIPLLPEALGGTPAVAQLVLAAYAGGTGVGLILYGALGARHDQRLLLLTAIVAFAALSALAPLLTSVESLVALRAVQGFFGAAAAVFAPGMVRSLFDDAGAMRALGILGSIESLTPALAPIAGAWLLGFGGWWTGFVVLAGAAGLIALLVSVSWRGLPDPGAARRSSEDRGSYRVLLGSGPFLRYALSQTGSLGGLLIFVFGAPAVIVGAMGGELADFVRMQVIGISTFIVASNVAGFFASRFGAERMIAIGSLTSLGGALALCVYGLAGGRDPAWLPWLFVPMNMGLGLRGPPGFLRAIQAGRGDDARAAALVMLLVFAATALGTAVVAPFITLGLVPLTAAAVVVSGSGCLALLLLPPLEDL